MNMRDLINIITEATISEKPPGTQFLLSNSEPGRAVADALKHQGINVEEPMTSVAWGTDAQDPKKYAATYGKNKPGIPYAAFRDISGKLWIYYGSPSGMKNCFTHVTANRGEVAEGILGAAMFAKFTKRAPQQEIAQVTPQDIERVINSMKQTKSTETTTTYEIQVQDSDNKHADNIKFSLDLKTAPKQALFDPAKRKEYAEEFNSAAAYVNTPNAERYSRYFYINGKADNINVISAGATSETTSKVDVFVEANGQKLRLNTSLKVGGVKQFGQVGGSEFESMIKLWRYFGVDISSYATQYEKLRGADQFNALEYIYRNIATQLSKDLAGDNDTEEAKFVTEIANSVSYFATLGDKNVKLVDFSKNGFKILRFNDLVQKMRGVNLTVSYKDEKGRPEIGIHAVGEPKNTLISVRVKIENKDDGTQYARNLIEKGPLLEKLTMEKQGKWTGDAGSKAIPRTPAKKAVAPVAKQPATAPVVPTRVAKQTAPVAQSPVTPNLKMDEPVQAKPRPQRTVVQPARPRR
jgi:hypothetical protein